VRKADNLPPSCAVVTKSRKLNSWNLLGLSRPVMGLLYIIVLSTPDHISSGLILILSSYINRCLTRGLFASVFTTTAVYAHLIPFMQVTCPTRLFLLDFKILITRGEQYSSLLCGFLCPPVNTCLLGLYNALSTLSQAPRVCILPLI